MTEAPRRAARRGFIDDEPEIEEAAPRRAARRAAPESSLITDPEELATAAPAQRAIPELGPLPKLSSVLPIALLEEAQLRRENPRRRAPLRALLDRFLLGGSEGARRGMVDPQELLASELIRLSELDPRWGFLQAVRRTDDGPVFDHWAIGPGGVFLLSAKHVPGAKVLVTGDRFLVNGEESGYVPQLRGDARRSADNLASESAWDYGINGVIVPVQERRLVVERSPLDISVIDPGDIANWLVNRPEQMAKKDILTAFSTARDKATWSPKQGT